MMEASRPTGADQGWVNALVRRGRDVAFIVDGAGRIVFVPDVAHPPLGYRPAAVVGRSALDLVHPDDREHARQVLERTLQQRQPQDPVTLRALASDGRWLLVELAVTNMLDDPLVAGIVVNLRDVTQERATEEALRESEALYRSIVETAQEGVWLIDDTGRSLFVNESLAEILGRTVDDLRAMNVFEVVDRAAQSEAHRRLRQRRSTGHEVYEIAFVRGDGARRWASVSASPLFVKQEYVGSLLMISDITERRATQDELERRALYDDLTGLPNRTLLHDRLEQALRHRDASHSVGVFFIDLDDFKAVNDSYGHAAGDQVLREVGDRIRAVLRDDDTLARFAGDEFVLVRTEVDGELDADALATQVLTAVTRPLTVDGHIIELNASIGVALHEPPADGEQLLRDADVAMFQAKNLGRGRHVMFDADVARQSRYHLEDVHELRAAIEGGEVEVFYQPQVDMETRTVCGVEALARWRHPRRGLLQPDEFIALAEASGLIAALGRRVLETACLQVAQWQRTLAEPLSVAVNVSAGQLDDERLPDVVRGALEASGLPPGHLVLELTETAVMSNTERAVRMLHELRAQGVHLAIDDFGTGYSSLVHLKRLPVEEIKIDREFVDGVDQTGDDRSIVGAVLNMARALDLRVVAEGVETTSQADALQDMGCTVGQGYLYGRPVDAAALAAVLPSG
jgi:diguanylate cyclase (GGDEF)-like protein/PAS domain S-box-containing protein